MRNFFEVKKNNGFATVVFNRGKVNAINGEVVNQLREILESLEDDVKIKAIVLTGTGRFFSFGFDIPEFLSFSAEQFTEFVKKFTDLYAYLFLFPKPIVAALNGHAIAGGCMLALACDYRIMVNNNAKIGLNEINFGSTVFTGSTEMLRYWVGDANATNVLCSGKMFSASEAKSLGLVEQIVSENDLLKSAMEMATDLSSKSLPAFSSIKRLLRKPVLENIRLREIDSIEEFIKIWYSKETWANLQNIKIYNSK